MQVEVQYIISFFASSVVFDSLQQHGLQPARLLCPQNFPGKNTGFGCHLLLHQYLIISGIQQLDDKYVRMTVFVQERKNYITYYAIIVIFLHDTYAHMCVCLHTIHHRRDFLFQVCLLHQSGCSTKPRTIPVLFMTRSGMYQAFRNVCWKSPEPLSRLPELESSLRKKLSYRPLCVQCFLL